MFAGKALSTLRAATSEGDAAAGRFNHVQVFRILVLAGELRALVDQATAPATTVEPAARGQGMPFLLLLPTELRVQILQRLDVRSLGRLAFTCRQLYCRPPCLSRPMSVVEEELRRRAEEAGRWLPPSTPEGVSGWVPFLLQREWRSSLELSTVAAGLAPHSLFVDADDGLLVCGMENRLGLLGLPAQPAPSGRADAEQH
jgi:hypothetical protein